MGLEDCFHKKTKKTRAGKRRLTNNEESVVLLTQPLRDDLGKQYIPFCSFGFHQGLVREGYGVCESRKCMHYRRLYVNSEESRVYKK